MYCIFNILWYNWRIVSWMGFKRPLVRIQSLGPRRSKLYIACSDFFQKAERAHAAAPPFQIEPAPLGFDLVLAWRRNQVRYEQPHQINRWKRCVFGGFCIFLKSFQGRPKIKAYKKARCLAKNTVFYIDSKKGKLSMATIISNTKGSKAVALIVCLESLLS